MPSTLPALLQDTEENLRILQERIGHRFNSQLLLLRALIHSSFAFENPYASQHNETLEFLGDSVLDLTLGFILLTRFPELREGKLTRIRAALVSENGLTTSARAIHLGEHLLLGKGEESSGGRDKPSILSSAYEALLGAIFLDAGYDTALDFVRRHFAEQLDTQQEQLLSSDAKSALQEYLQEHHNQGPCYTICGEEGPAHARIFSVSVSFRGQELGRGQAGSKKEAEQQAAQAALLHLRQGSQEEH
ncbi:MAG: ribonuclease III [Desulfobulbus sp.]|jgi:ribonuclease-3